MKNFPFIAFILILFSCKTEVNKQTKAENLVKRFLDSTLNDPKSYESIKFSKLDTVLSSVMDSKEYLHYENKADSLKARFDELDSKMDNATTSAQLNAIAKESDRLTAERLKVANDKEKLILSYKGKFEAYKIRHDYRGKNSFGALIKTTTNFVLDSNLTKVENVYKVD